MTGPGPEGRRLTARSVIASTLLGVDPPQLPTRSLVATAELLGVAPGTARVAMSRMVAAGELAATDDGYRLAGGPLLARQARQRLSRQGPTENWDGTWTMAVATAERRSATERADLRDAMAALRYGLLRDGVWLRPDNLPPATLPAAEVHVTAQCARFSCRPDHPAEVVDALWDLTTWARTATELTTALAVQLERLEDGPWHGSRDARTGPAGLAEGFVVSARVLRHLQADPLLPTELLDRRWPGPSLRAAHHRYDQVFKRTLADWQRSLADRP